MPPAYNRPLLKEELRYVLEHLPRSLKAAGFESVIPRWACEGKRAAEPDKYAALTNVGRRAVGDPITKKQQLLKAFLPVFETARKKAAAKILGEGKSVNAYSEANFIIKLVRPLGDVLGFEEDSTAALERLGDRSQSGAVERVLEVAAGLLPKGTQIFDSSVKQKASSARDGGDPSPSEPRSERPIRQRCTAVRASEYSLPSKAERVYVSTVSCVHDARVIALNIRNKLFGMVRRVRLQHPRASESTGPRPRQIPGDHSTYSRFHAVTIRKTIGSKNASRTKSVA